MKKQPGKMIAYRCHAADRQADLYFDNQIHRSCHAAVKGGDGR